MSTADKSQQQQPGRAISKRQKKRRAERQVDALNAF